MASKTSAKANIFLTINLVCSYILTAAASPPLSPTVGGEYGGSAQGQQPEKCPMDALKLGVCANLLGGLVRVVIGDPSPTTTATTTPCCSLLAGLVDLEVALCLCLAVKANVLGIVNLNIPISLNLLLNACGRTPPTGFTCA